MLKEREKRIIEEQKKYQGQQDGDMDGMNHDSKEGNIDGDAVDDGEGQDKDAKDVTM